MAILGVGVRCEKDSPKTGIGRQAWCIFGNCAPVTEEGLLVFESYSGIETGMPMMSKDSAMACNQPRKMMGIESIVIGLWEVQAFLVPH